MTCWLSRLAGSLGLLLLLTALARGGDPVAREMPEVRQHNGAVTVQLRSGSHTTLGRLIEYNRFQAILLRRDGRMVEFRRQDIDDIRPASGFVPYTSLQLQEHYRKLFGDGYEVSRTRHYVVVHPQGLKRQWADPLDELYHRFRYYFSVRGFSLATPEFPMVVVVLDSRSGFRKVAARDGLENPAAWAGYYSSESNWIVTCRDAGQPASHWEDNATLIHEALHQYAFNHGIHQRWAPTPQWCAEGLATMFEARGVNNARDNRQERDRLNRSCLRLLHHTMGGDRRSGLLRQAVASDRLFQEDTPLAYALSWGLVFYLAERYPAEFNAYLQRVALRDRRSAYTASDRLADFGEAFGGDFALLESHFRQFLQELR
jgi:hypothetical protein